MSFGGQMTMSSPMQMLRVPTLMDVLFAVLLVVCLKVAYVVICMQLKRNEKYPPFAPGGMKEHLQIVTSPMYPWRLLELSKQLHTGVFQLSLPIYPTIPYVVVSDPTVVRAILTDPLTYKPDMYNCLRKVFGGPTMLTSNGQMWHTKRKAVASAFSSNHIKRMTRVAMENIETWIQQTLKVLCSSNESFDVEEEMMSIIVLALSETAFEYKMTVEEAKLFKENLDIALIEFTRKDPTNPLRKYCVGGILPERQRAFRALDYLHGFVRHVMAEYRMKDKKSTTSGTIIQLVMESDAFPTDEEKMAQLTEFLFAGHDTTAYSISWILLCLAKHPEEQAKLRASLGGLSSENWRNSEVLRNVIKEGMRIYPVVRSIRMTGRDIMTSSGLIPKGSYCSLKFLLTFWNPEIFDQPDVFNPSRWENPTREMKDAFYPFALGKQNCAGQSLAQAEMHAVVARLCSEFELSVECEGTSAFSVTLKPVGVRLKASKV